MQIAYDRQALVRLGLDLREVADLVRTKIRGSSATEYRKRERRIDIVVRLGEGDRATVRQLRNLVVNPGAAMPVPLSAVADVTLAAGPADIRRVGQRRVALLQANLAGGGLSSASRAIEERLGGMDWPEGTAWRLAGQVQEMERSLGSLWQALALSIFLVYVVMASQFESLLHPLLIMITVPLALLGVVAVLWLLCDPAVGGGLPGHDHAGRHRGQQRHRADRLRQHPARARAWAWRRRWSRPVRCGCGRS